MSKLRITIRKVDRSTDYKVWTVFIDLSDVVICISTFSFRRALGLTRALLSPNSINQYVRMKWSEVSREYKQAHSNSEEV